MKNPFFPFVNFYKYQKKEGFKKAYKDWKYQFIMLDTPKQLLKKEIMSYSGLLGGMTLAIIILITRGNWYFAIPMLFTLLIMWYQLKAKLKALQSWKDLEEQTKELVDDGIIEEVK